VSQRSVGLSVFYAFDGRAIANLGVEDREALLTMQAARLRLAELVSYGMIKERV
jgi:hypothetical protein